MSDPVYKRVLIKISGEALAGDNKTGFDFEFMSKVGETVKSCVEMGVEVGIVVGGGNIFRGAKEASKGLDRSVADQVCMLATVMNALYLQNALEKLGIEARVLSGLSIPEVCEDYIYRRALRHLQKNRVLIFAAGTGCPYFTTDTGAALRASEMKCDALLKATQVDGVYDTDPRQNADAVKYNEVTYDEVISKGLGVMDLTAVSLAKDNRIPIVVFAQKGENALLNAVTGQGEFTIIK